MLTLLNEKYATNPSFLKIKKTNFILVAVPSLVTSLISLVESYTMEYYTRIQKRTQKKIKSKKKFK